MHEGASEDSFASAVAQVDESAPWHIKRIVPAVRVFVLPSLLNPLENLEEALEFNLSVGQTDLLQSFFVALAATFDLTRRQKKR